MARIHARHGNALDRRLVELLGGEAAPIVGFGVRSRPGTV